MRETDHQKQKLWTGLFIVICALGLGISLVQRLLDNTLAIYATDMWDSKTYGGWMTSGFTFGSIAACVFGGSLADRVGRQKAFIIGAAMFIAGTVCMLFTTSPWVMLALRAVQGAARAFAMVAAAAMAADVIPTARMGEGMGYYGLGTTLANAFGPTLGLAMIAGGSYNFMFGSCAAIYAAMLVTALFIRYEKTRRSAAKSGEKARSLGALLGQLFERGALPAAVVDFFVGAGNVCVLTFLTLYAKEELGIENSGMFFTMAAIGMVVSRLFCGRIVDRHGALVVMIPSLLVGIGTYALLAFAAPHSYAVFLLCGLLYGIQQGSSYPTVQAVAVVDSPRDRRGTASSTITFGMDLGILISATILGSLLDSRGYVPMFLTGMGIYAVGILLAIPMFGNKARAARRARMGVEL